MDISKLISVAPILLKWGGLISIIFSILWYGSLARIGLPRLNFAYRMLMRLALGALVFFSAKGLAQFVPITIANEAFSLLVPIVQNAIAGTGLAIALAIGFFIFFWDDRRKKPLENLAKQLKNPKRIIGGAMIVVLLIVSIFGLIVPKPEKTGLELPGIGELMKEEDADCLNARTVLDLMANEGYFEKEPIPYLTPEKLGFLTAEYSGFKIKSPSVAETSKGTYILAVLVEDKYDSTGDFSGPEEMMSAKLCTIRPSDMKKCDCTRFLGVADIFAKITKTAFGDLEKIQTQ